MSTTQEKTETNAQLRAEALERDIRALFFSSRSKARRAYSIGLFFMACAILASVVAAIGGILQFDPRVVGTLALIPGVIAIVPTNLKLQARANWHYRKKDEAQSLLNVLQYGLSDPPTIDEVKKIAADLNALNRKMGRDWEGALGIWSSPAHSEGQNGTSGGSARLPEPSAGTFTGRSS